MDKRLRKEWACPAVKPSIKQIIRAATEVMDVDSIGMNKATGITPRKFRVSTARYLAWMLAKNILGMSSTEFRDAVGVKSHCDFVGRGTIYSAFLNNTTAGMAVYNHTVDRLYDIVTNQRPRGTKPLPPQPPSEPESDYKAITRNALRGHTGDAV